VPALSSLPQAPSVALGRLGEEVLPRPAQAQLRSLDTCALGSTAPLGSPVSAIKQARRRARSSRSPGSEQRPRDKRLVIAGEFEAAAENPLVLRPSRLASTTFGAGRIFSYSRPVGPWLGRRRQWPVRPDEVVEK